MKDSVKYVNKKSRNYLKYKGRSRKTVCKWYAKRIEEGFVMTRHLWLIGFRELCVL